MQHHAIPCNTMQYHATPCNTMQYRAAPCNTMQYHASLIAADGAYHCPVGSIRPFFQTNCLHLSYIACFVFRLLYWVFGSAHIKATVGTTVVSRRPLALGLHQEQMQFHYQEVDIERHFQYAVAASQAFCFAGAKVYFERAFPFILVTEDRVER